MQTCWPNWPMQSPDPMRSWLNDGDEINIWDACKPQSSNLSDILWLALQMSFYLKVEHC